MNTIITYPPRKPLEKREPMNVELECGHTNKFTVPPYLQDVVWCYPCRDFRTVVGGDTAGLKAADLSFKYKATCTECTFARNTDTESEAIVKGETHCLRHAHVVRVISRKYKVLATITPSIVTEP